MKPKGLLVAVVALAVLGGLIWWSNRKQLANAGKSATDTAIKLMTIPDDQFQEIRIKKLTGEVQDLKRDGLKWRITQPKEFQADQDTVGAMVSALDKLTAEKTIEDNAADLSPYGLNIPTLDITVTQKDGETAELLVGDSTPSNSAAYVKLPGNPHVYTVAMSVKTSLDKVLIEIRDKRLLTFDSEKLTRLQLTVKGTTIEFGKSGQFDWQILKPRPLRADSAQVVALIDKLGDAKMDPLASDDDNKKAAAAFTSGAKVAVLVATDAAGTQTLEVRQQDIYYYAKSSVVEGVFKVPKDVGDALDKTLDDFRDKKLFEFGFSDPTKIELKTASYAKIGDKWMAGAKAMDNTTVQSLIDKLRDFSATKFVDKGAGDPVFEATVTSDSGKRVEKVSVRKQGAQYFAQREGEPSIYEVDANAVDELEKAASGIKETAPEPKKK